MPLPLLAATLLLPPLLTWSQLPAIPDAEGFAGVFAGTSGGALMVAGGANFPSGRPWEGGAKVWHDRVVVLEPGGTTWREAGRLPAPLAYGVSASYAERVVCIGGSDADRHHAAVHAIRWDGHAVAITPLPPLPRPLALHCGALLGTTIVIAGGVESPTSVEASRACLALDLADPGGDWHELPAFPGPGRILATAGVADGAFHLFGGAGLVRGGDGQPRRVWLRDAYRYDPATGWSRLPDLPRPVVATPSPAPLLGGMLLLLGGDDGGQAEQAQADHSGFRHDPLGFDPAHRRWEPLGDLPFALVTTAAVPWAGGVVIPGGEMRPGVRSTQVWHGVVGAAGRQISPTR